MGADNHPTTKVKNMNNQNEDMYTISVIDANGNQVGQFQQSGRMKVIAQNRAWKYITDNPQEFNADNRRELTGYTIDMELE